MDNKDKLIIESILFSTGKEVSVKDLSLILEISQEDVIKVINELKAEYDDNKRGMQIIKTKDCYQMTTRQDYYEYILQLTDKKGKPNLSNAALEVLSIIAYNPNVTRAEMEVIRGVNCDATIYKLLEYNLIEESGKLDAPGRPTTYVVTSKFMKLFGIEDLEQLPKLPKYRLDENHQIVIDESEE